MDAPTATGTAPCADNTPMNMPKDAQLDVDLGLSWRNRFAQCIKEAQQDGSVNKTQDHIELAEFFQSGWHGAIMRAKTTKTTVPLDAFMTLMFDQVLKA